MEENVRLETLRLCKLWLDLLDRAGKYAHLYYSYRALERGFGAQYDRACKMLSNSYKTKENLNKAIHAYLDAFPAKLLEILDAQTACGLHAFSNQRRYLDQIMMGLTMLDRHGDQRRAHYRYQINRVLKAASTEGKQATALSLNQLEANFQEKLHKATKKAA